MRQLSYNFRTDCANAFRARFECSTATLTAGLDLDKEMPWLLDRCAINWTHYFTAMVCTIYTHTNKTNSIQALLYAFPTYLPYWPNSRKALEVADLSLFKLFQPHAQRSDRLRKMLVRTNCFSLQAVFLFRCRLRYRTLMKGLTESSKTIKTNDGCILRS